LTWVKRVESEVDCQAKKPGLFGLNNLSSIGTLFSIKTIQVLLLPSLEVSGFRKRNERSATRRIVQVINCGGTHVDSVGVATGGRLVNDPMKSGTNFGLK